MSPHVLAVIPARYASTRFPGKPLAVIDGKPMVQWVFEAATACEALSAVKVATDDKRIAEAVTGFGGEVELTRTDHQSGTDRVAEVADRYPEAEIVVNLQGDQPFVTPEVLQRLIDPYFVESGTTVPQMTTVACALESDRHRDPHTVKVICDQSMHAIYFSRAMIPYGSNGTPLPVYHHLGLYAFQASFLNSFQRLAPTPLEKCESLEQLRVLEHGHKIRVSLVDRMIHEVNVPEDLELAHSLATCRG